MENIFRCELLNDNTDDMDNTNNTDDMDNTNNTDDMDNINNTDDMDNINNTDNTDKLAIHNSDQSHNDNTNNNTKDIPLRLVFLGNVDSGKTTLVSVLSNNKLDNGKGEARANIFRHPHEKASGRTSAIAMKFCNINKRKSILIDLCGHERYLKTTLFGLNLTHPDYCFIVVAANMGVSKMTIEHITMAISLGYRLVICITKMDISPVHVTQNTLKTINILLMDKMKKNVVILNNFRVATMSNEHLEDIVTNYVPVVKISNVKGSGIGKLKSLINRLPAIRKYNSEGETEFIVDDYFHLKGIGLVLSGTVIKGNLAVGDKLELGTNKNNEFRSIEVRSLYVDNKPINTISAGHHCTIGIRLNNKNNNNNKNKNKKNLINELNVRRGMVAVDPKLVEESRTRNFTADIYILHHQTTITDNRDNHSRRGYQAIIHCNGIRQTAEMTKIYNETGFIRSGDSVRADFKFCYHDEYLKVGERFIFREGWSRGIGKIISINNS